MTIPGSNPERTVIPLGAAAIGNAEDDGLTEEGPLDQDIDDNAVDSADADERAAREGTKGEVDDRP
ncbi:hypothetical protein G5T42_00550 [Microbacterium sp. 4R-513]|uniref:hypothetical protein n=1 Tax=Microbacterium sp. 4R-513 TaxID=2567934 RepID=UPI0013E137A5|nr:hypothetical protein [Microbacterium sp. 4R-513]QIG38154.1 hypothetical protein G5T42_00550 [Microbacterium sp. 4R-513]